jgi:hypothetical protein
MIAIEVLEELTSMLEEANHKKNITFQCDVFKKDRDFCVMGLDVFLPKMKSNYDNCPMTIFFHEDSIQLYIALADRIVKDKHDDGVDYVNFLNKEFFGAKFVYAVIDDKFERIEMKKDIELKGFNHEIMLTVIIHFAALIDEVVFRYGDGLNEFWAHRIEAD